MEKILSDVSEVIKERLKNSFIFSFIIAWIVFNWKAIAFFIFSDINIYGRLYFIEAHYTNPDNYIFYPLIVAFFYVVLLPYLMLLFGWLRKFEIIILEKRNDAKNRRIIQYDLDLETLKAGGRDTESLNQEIASLKQIISQKNNLISEFQNSAKFTSEDMKNALQNLNNDDVKIFRKLGETILQGESLDAKIPNQLLYKFEALGLINKSLNGDGYYFNNMGIRLLNFLEKHEEDIKFN